ncbi:MAG TPA: hypothetical protein VIE68_11335 [Gemmatimonadota bacterium]|jgi:hypothetical protein
MRIVASMLVALVVAGCSQRVTPEEEFARQERERPLVTLESGQSPGAAGTGLSSAPMEAPVDDAQTITGTIAAPPGASGSVLFLFVRPAGATGGPPLAVQRVPSPGFPREFAIGPRDAMVAGGPFPERVTLEARLDEDGNAMTEGPADLSARIETAPGATGVALTLAPTT